MCDKNREYEEFLRLYERKSSAGSSRDMQSQSQSRYSEDSSESQTAPQQDTSTTHTSRSAVNNREYLRTEQYIRKKRRTAKKRRRQLSVAIAAVLLIGIIVSVILVIRSCGSKDLFKGTWDLDGITVYQFDGKGNGALILPGNTYSFTYTIKGDSISIDFESEAARDVTYVFTVEKEKLLIKAENHTEATYELTKRNDG